MSQSEKFPFKTDVAVLLIFFNRPATFRKVFDAVRNARPSRLFLYQDGAREGNEGDMRGIAECRAIASDENIDWQCDVRRMYRERNYGCDPSEYLSQKWAFSMADKCVVLEDDDVPSPSFISFCKKMLDRYEHDSRVWLISGFNAEEVTSAVPYDYFFTSVFSIWGWASWRRVVDTWDGDYSFMRDDFKRQALVDIVRERNYRHDFMRMCADHAAAGKPYYESIFWAGMLMNNGLAVMPRKNMVCNVGAMADSTHFSSLPTMPHRLREMFTMPAYNIEEPLKHPDCVMEYMPYKETYYRIQGWNHPLIKISRSFEELWLNIRAGHFGNIRRSFIRRVHKWMGLDRHA